MVQCFFFFQAEDGIRDYKVTGVQTCALPILRRSPSRDGHLVDDVVDHHLNRHAMAGGMRTEPYAMAQDIASEILDVFGIDLVATAIQQRPYFDQPAPADRRAGRGPEVDALFDHFRGRTVM